MTDLNERGEHMYDGVSVRAPWEQAEHDAGRHENCAPAQCEAQGGGLSMRSGPMTLRQLVHRLNPWHRHELDWTERCRCGEPFVYWYCARCKAQPPSDDPVREFIWTHRHVCEDSQ